METKTVKKQSNRAIQREHATYKSKGEISEALHLIRPYVNVSTYKFLSHFLHTNGSGVTQMKIAEWCKKVGVSLGSYNKTVKPEIENTLSQSLIIKTDAPMKYDAKRKKKVKASEYKSLLPLSVIKHQIKLKAWKEEQEEQERFLQQIQLENDPDFTQSEIASEIEGEIASEIESIPSTPCESKDEGAFEQQQNKSFREKHLEKNIKTITTNNKSILEYDSFSSPDSDKKYFLKKETKAILREVQKEMRNDGLKELTAKQTEICGNKIQQFAHDYKLQVTEIHEMAIDTIYSSVNYNTYDFGGFIYKSLENSFIDQLLKAYGIDIENDFDLAKEEGREELNALRAKMKTAYFDKENELAIDQVIINHQIERAELETAATSERPKKTALQAKRGKRREQKATAWMTEAGQNALNPDSPRVAIWNNSKAIFRELKTNSAKSMSQEEKEKEINYLFMAMDTDTTTTSQEMTV